MKVSMLNYALAGLILCAVAGLAADEAQVTSNVVATPLLLKTEKSDMRVDYRDVAPGIGQAMMGLENYVRSSGLEKSLLNLVRMRSSQINGCAFCLDMHFKDAREAGETVERLGSIEEWRKATCFTPREKAALEWAEQVTLIAKNHPTEDQVKNMLKHFSQKELADLTLAIISINGWNRLNISFRNEPEFCPVD